MRKVVAFALAMVTLLTMLVLPISAAEETEATVGEGVYGTDWVKYGDLDNNETIDAKDALAVLKYAVEKIEFSEVQEIVADVTKDTAVDAKDALDILKFAVDKITAFTAGVFYQITQAEPEPEPELPVLDEDFIAKYDKSNSVNGAYETDPTAETDFKLDISSLSKNTYYRIGSSVWVDKEGVANTADIQRLLYSLQGLVNRDFGMDSDHTSLIYVIGSSQDNGWLSEMQFEGSIFAGASEDGTKEGLYEVRIGHLDDFLETFGDVIKTAGIILWDGNVPATANVAGTICGLDGYLPVLAESPLHHTLVEMGVPVKQSLVGLFENGKRGQKIKGTNVDSTGSAKNDAYLWAMEKYFHRCSSHYIAYTLDGAPTLKGYKAYADHPTALLSDAGQNCLSNHDYLIARRCFFFDLAPYKYEAACDDPAQKQGLAPQGTDNATMIKIFERRFQRANGAFGQLLGFPPWWLKYATHSEQGSKPGTWIEWLFTEYITCYNLAKEADAAHPCSMTNGSFYYKYVPKTNQYENNEKVDTSITYNPNDYYYTIYIGDYDSSAWLKEHMYDMWIDRGGDRFLGKVKMMWSINPNLSERVPMVFDYMYEHKSDNDYFVGGDGGAGYIIPEALFTNKTLAYMGEKRPAANGNGGAVFAAYSKEFYDRFDMKITGFIINGGQPAVSKEMAECISQYSPLLNFTNCSWTPLVKYNNTYFVYCQNGLDKKSPDSPDNLQKMYNFFDNSMGGYKFSAYRTICWTPTQIKKVVTAFETYAADKGRTVHYIDPYTYVKMLRAANNATVIS